MKWANLSSRRIANLSRETICVLPIGAMEQHGPHLPVATDTIIAESIAAKLDDACQGKLLVMPALAMTCSEHHMAFAGTLSVAHETLLNVVTQIVQSGAKHEFRRFFLLNAHGGNMAIGGVIAEQLASLLPQVDIVFATWFRTAADKLRPLVEGAYPAVGHACEFETSLIMAVRPELVERDEIVDDGLAPASPLLRSDLLAGGPTVRAVPFDRITASGVWGKPTLATAEKGRAILEIVVPAIRELLGAHWPEAPGIKSSEASPRFARGTGQGMDGRMAQ